MNKIVEVQEVVQVMKTLSDPGKIEYKLKKFGIPMQNALGIYNKDLNELRKRIGTNSKLALQLYDTGIYEAKIVCAKCFSPKDLTMVNHSLWYLLNSTNRLTFLSFNVTT